MFTSRSSSQGSVSELIAAATAANAAHRNLLVTRRLGGGVRGGRGWGVEHMVCVAQGRVRRVAVLRGCAEWCFQGVRVWGFRWLS